MKTSGNKSDSTQYLGVDMTRVTRVTSTWGLDQPTVVSTTVTTKGLVFLFLDYSHTVQDPLTPTLINYLS